MAGRAHACECTQPHAHLWVTTNVQQIRKVHLIQFCLSVLDILRVMPHPVTSGLSSEAVDCSAQLEHDAKRFAVKQDRFFICDYCGNEVRFSQGRITVNTSRSGDRTDCTLYISQSTGFRIKLGNAFGSKARQVSRSRQPVHQRIGRLQVPFAIYQSCTAAHGATLGAYDAQNIKRTWPLTTYPASTDGSIACDGHIAIYSHTMA